MIAARLDVMCHNMYARMFKSQAAQPTYQLAVLFFEVTDDEAELVINSPFREFPLTVVKLSTLGVEECQKILCGLGLVSEDLTDLPELRDQVRTTIGIVRAIVLFM